MKDITYLKDILNHVKSTHVISPDEIFLMGHSNGGVFATLVAIFLPNEFSGICSHMGGIGWDSNFVLNFDVIKDTDKKTPVLVVTGDRDGYRRPCEIARDLFLGEGFPVDFFLVEDTGHEYKPGEVEEFVWKWFMSR
jgi:predicted esterase